MPERGHAYVFVVRDNVVERREVRTGKRRPGYVEIVDGVHEHERVVVDGTQNVRDGSVRPGSRRATARADACGSRSCRSAGRSSRPSSACCW